MGIPEITPKQLKARMDAGEELLILDVREPFEHSICHLDALLIPLNDLPGRLGELDADKEIVVYCRSGQRSAKATVFLMQSGFDKVTNLAGGILAWSDEVDPSVPKY